MIAIPRILVWLGAVYLVARAGVWAWVSIIPLNPLRGYAIAAAFALLAVVGLLRVWKLPKDRPLIWYFLIMSLVMVIDSWVFKIYTEKVMEQVSEKDTYYRRESGPSLRALRATKR